MERQGISKDDLQSSEEGFWFERRLWASYRGQTLARTVRGMMYYSRLGPGYHFFHDTG